MNKFIIFLLLFLFCLSSVATSTITRYGSDFKIVGNEISFKINDRLGSDRLTLDDENVVAESNNLPYGQQLKNSNVKFGFTGKELDASNNYYFNARYYDFDSSKFLGVDPVSNNHAYSYVSNNPMNMIDPDGMRLKVVPVSEACMDISTYIDDENVYLEDTLLNIVDISTYVLGEDANREVLNFDDTLVNVVDNLNSFFEDDLFYADDFGYITSKEVYDGTNSDKRSLFRIINDVIEHSEEVNIVYMRSLNPAGFFIGKNHLVIQESTSIDNSVLNLGKWGQEISFSDPAIALIHELGHVRGLLLSPDKTNRLTYGESVAIASENIGRRIKGMPERFYYDIFLKYSDFDDDYYSIYARTPRNYDKFSDSFDFILYEPIFPDSTIQTTDLNLEDIDE